MRGAAFLGDPWYQTLLLRAARRGLAEIWILRVDDDDAAFALGLRAHSQFHYAWTAFKLRYQPLSIGNSLHSAVIRTVCEEGCARLDFGHGNSQWKRFLATDTHTVSRAALGRGLRGRLVAHAYVTAWQLARFERCRCAFRTARSLLQSTKTRLSRVLHSSALSAETAGGSTSPHQAVGISARAIMMTDRVDVGAPRECQLMTNWAIAAEPPHWRVARRMRRLLRALVRFRRTASSPTKSATPRLEKPPITHRQDGALQPGDRVRIRDLADIEATLDATSRYHGCAFLKPMARYCGREFRVVRCVERFFDERQWRMLKCKNIVLLEGAYCDGSGALSTRGCDRMCFFFWRTEWLEKLT